MSPKEEALPRENVGKCFKIRDLGLSFLLALCRVMCETKVFNNTMLCVRCVTHLSAHTITLIFTDKSHLQRTSWKCKWQTSESFSSRVFSQGRTENNFMSINKSNVMNWSMHNSFPKKLKTLRCLFPLARYWIWGWSTHLYCNGLNS